MNLERVNAAYTAEAVGITQNEPIRIRHSTTAGQTITTDFGHPALSLSRPAELQAAGVHADALAAVRFQRLGHLVRLLGLWQVALSPENSDSGPRR